MHSGLVVSKRFFQVEYPIIGQMLKNYTGFDGNNISNSIDYQLLADTFMMKVK